MAISIRDQQILNRFADTQPGLQRTGEKPSIASLPLGDILLPATAMGAFSFSYSFAKNGAIPSSGVVLDTRQLPVGAIIVSVVMDVITGIAQGTAAPIILSLYNSAGTAISSIQSIPSTSFSSAQVTSYAPSTVYKATPAVKNLGIQTANPNTSGVANFYMYYINPLQSAK